MRHDPASAAVVVMLRGLKMYGMAQAVGDLIEQGAPAFEAAVCAVYLHGAAADRAAAVHGEAGMLPHDLFAALGTLFAENGR